MHNELPLSPKVVTLVNAHVLTASYGDTGAYGYAVTDLANYLGLLISYTKGDESGAQIKVEGTGDVSLGLATTVAKSTNWFQRVAESTTGGKTALSQDYYEVTATGKYAENISPIKGDGVKVSVQADTLGVAPGTITIYGIVSWI
jgi:hypothetical protein